MKEIEFSQWLFELPAKQHSQFSPSGTIFLESPHQVDMKIVVKSSKHFFWYFNILQKLTVLSMQSHVHISSVQKWSIFEFLGCLQCCQEILTNGNHKYLSLMAELNKQQQKHYTYSNLTKHHGLFQGILISKSLVEH